MNKLWISLTGVSFSFRPHAVERMDSFNGLIQKGYRWLSESADERLQNLIECKAADQKHGYGAREKFNASLTATKFIPCKLLQMEHGTEISARIQTIY